MIQSKLFTEYSHVTALHLHPRHYTCLIEVDQDLFYYDCFASIQLWSLKIEGELMLAFSLDFNKIYALQGKEITAICKGVQNKVCKTNIENPDYFILNELYYIFIKENRIHLQKRVTNAIRTIELTTDYSQIIMLQQSTTPHQLKWIAISQHKLQFLQVDLQLFKVAVVSSYQVEPGTVKLCKQDEVHKKICLIVDEEITILSYKNGLLKFLQKVSYDRVIRDIAFFTYGENTDSVGGKYKTEHLLVLAHQGEAVDVLELATGVIKGTFKLSKPVSHIYFNRLFNNSFITLSPTGEVTRVNIFGYDKEWVCLGIKFVEIECNEVYEEKEDDYELPVETKKVVSVEEMDDASLSIFSPEEMLQNRVKRISFDI